MWPFRILGRSLLRRSLLAGVTSAAMLGPVKNSFNEDDIRTPEMPANPVQIPQSELTYDFLIRQSAVVSSADATRLLTHVMSALMDSATQYVNALEELRALYEDASSEGLSLTAAGEERMTELKESISQLKTCVYDLELLFLYVAKLVDSSVEVSFLAGAEFSSKQGSEVVHSARSMASSLLDRARLCEADLAKAQSLYITATAGRTSD